MASGIKPKRSGETAKKRFQRIIIAILALLLILTMLTGLLPFFYSPPRQEYTPPPSAISAYHGSGNCIQANM